MDDSTQRLINTAQFTRMQASEAAVTAADTRRRASTMRKSLAANREPDDARANTASGTRPLREMSDVIAQLRRDSGVGDGM